MEGKYNIVWLNSVYECSRNSLLGGFHNSKNTMRYAPYKISGGARKPPEAMHHNVGYPEKVQGYICQLRALHIKTENRPPLLLSYIY